MTPTPPSTTSSSAGAHSPDAQYRVVRKRNRVPLSCAPCRNRKLKCNRSHPCENCIRRGDASSCSYAAPGRPKKNQSQGATSPNDLPNRIDRLEGLVLSLMTNGTPSAGPSAAKAAISSRHQSDSTASSAVHTEQEQDGDDDMIREEDEGQDSDVEGVTDSLGILKVDADKGKSLYFGDSHWHLVLADIAEVKNYFANHKKDLENNYEKIKQSTPRSQQEGPAFLFSSHISATDVELRAELPAKSAVDKLVTRYFNSYDPAIHILHSPTFHKQLLNHWQDPSKTSIIWLGLLYSILTLAMQSYNRIGDEPSEWKGRTFDLAAEFRLRTVQCLVNSDYTKSSNDTIETMLLYVHSEHNSKWDSDVGIWVIVGMIVRLAMRMGYHRDPSKYPSITPFQGEMRRRVWAFTRQMDTIFSFQLALPSMIRSTNCDTTLPSNIFDDEFGPESKILPPARPITEPTPLSYMITKAQISYEFGEILEELNGVSGKQVTYDDVLKRDSRLREFKVNMAPHLRLRPLDECTHDPTTLLMQRFLIDIFWQKAMCVLHRKYIARARQNSRYAHSRRACVEASMEILRHQAQLYKESQPGGRLRTMTWWINSLTKSDFLLAATLVCLELHSDGIKDSRLENSANHNMCFWTQAQRGEMMQALETCLNFWKESMDSSMEAYKAANILGIIIEKLKIFSQTPKTIPQTDNEVFASYKDSDLRPEHSAAMTLGMLSAGSASTSTALSSDMSTQSPGGTTYRMDIGTGDSSGGSGTGMTPNYSMDASAFGSINDAANGPFSMFGNTGASSGMLDMPVNLDWEAWDSFVQNGNATNAAFQFYPTALDPTLDVDGQQQMMDQYGNSVFMGANTPGR